MKDDVQPKKSKADRLTAQADEVGVLREVKGVIGPRVPANDPDKAGQHLTPVPNQEPVYARLDGEQERQWNARLLWTMQKKSKASYRATGRACSVSDVTVRKWAQKWEWSALRDAHGRSASQLAWRTYKTHFLHIHGLKQVIPLEKYLRFKPSKSIGSDVMAVLSEYGHEVPSKFSKGNAAYEAAQAIERANNQAAREDAEGREKMIRQQRQIVDGVIASAVKNLRDGDLKVTSRDLLLFLEAQQKMAGLDGSDKRLAGEESTRVRKARAEGEDVLIALRTDLRDSMVLADCLIASSRQEEANDLEAEKERQRLIAAEG